MTASAPVQITQDGVRAIRIVVYTLPRPIISHQLQVLGLDYKRISAHEVI